MPWLAYRRVSRVGKDREEYLPADYEQERDWQSQKIRPYAKAHKLDIEMLDPELDVSGGKVDRPILNEAVARIERGEAEGLIVGQLDRLSRAGIEDSLKVIRRVEDAGGKMIAVADNYDDSTPEGRMTRNVMLSLGEMQLDRSKELFARSKRRSVQDGIWPMSKVPIGYSCTRKRDGGDGKLYPTPDAKKVKTAFEARASGKPWVAIGEILGRSTSGAQKVIANPVYLGETHLKVDGEELREPNTHKAIVDRATWEAAQWERRARIKVVADSPALLAKIARCAGCGRTMTLGKVSRGQRLYRCNTRLSKSRYCEAPAIIAQGIVETYVEELVLPWLDSVYVESRPKTEHLATAMQELENAEAELATYQKAIEGLPAEQLSEGLRVRVAAVDTAQKEVRQAQSPGADIAISNGSLADAWPDMSVPEKNFILRAALGAIWVRKGKVSPWSDAGRVRVIEAGAIEPDSLSRSGWGGDVETFAVPDGKLKGQIRPLKR